MKPNAQARYQALRADREDYLQMGRTCAKLTLPYLLTDEGHTEGGPSVPHGNPWELKESMFWHLS